MRYRLLGPVTVEDGTDVVSLGGRRPRVLLATLLLHPNAPVPGATLIEGLWRDEPPARATTAVRVVLAQLRRVLEPQRRRGEPSALAHGPAGWVLSVPAGAIDAERFELLVERSRRAYDAGDLVRAGDLGRAALDEWRGAALADVVDELELAKAPARRWEELKLETVERTIESELHLGRHDALTGELTALVDAHPLRERLVSLLMVALYRGGRQAEALRVYEQARRRLVEQLGIEPTAPLAQLERAILLQEPVLDLPTTPLTPSPGAGGGRPAGAPAGPDRGRPAVPLPGVVVDVRRAGGLIGREGDLAKVAPVVEDMMRGGAETLVVSGPAGIGKTRLVAEIAASCHDRGALVLFGRCDREPVLSYQPFVEALGEHLAWLTGDPSGAGPDPGTALAVLSALTGARGPAGEHVGARPDAGDRYLLFESVADLLGEAGAGRPLVLVIDDLQWADEGTVALLRHLVRRLADRPVLLLVTTREVEGAPGVSGRALRADTQRDRMRRLALAGLSEDASLAVVSQEWAGHSCDDVRHVAPRIIELAEGSPFFLRHLARHLLAVGPAGAGPGQVSLPTEVSSLVETLVGSLSDDARQALLIGSVQGREFDLDVVGAVAVMEEDALLDAVDALLAAGLVVDDVSGSVDRYRFTHELVREACYRQLSSSRRGRLHEQIGAALEAIDDTQLMALSHHFSLAGRGERDKAAGYARRAGDQAMSVMAFDAAVSQYERAERLARRMGRAGGRDYVGLLIALGKAHMSLGRGERARRTFLEAVDLARRDGLPELVARAALGYSGEFGANPQSLDRAYAALLGSALADLTDEHATIRARVAARLAAVVLYLDGPAAAAGHSLEALRLGRDQGDPGALAAALHVRHLVLLSEAHPERRVELADEQLRCAARGSDVDLANALWDRTIDVMELGRRDETDAMLGAYRRQIGRGRPAIRWWAEVFDASVATARGELVEAERKVYSALARGEELRERELRRVFSGQMFVLRWLQGRLDDLQDSLDELVPAFPEDLAWRAGMALWFAEVGDHRAALVELERLTVAFERSLNAYAWLGSLAVAAEAASLVGPPAERVAARMLRHLDPYAGRHIVYLPGFALLGPCDRYLGGLLAVCGRPGAAAEAYTRAEMMAEASGTVPYALLARVALAGLAGEAGDGRPTAGVARTVAQAADLGLAAVVRRAERAGLAAGAAV
jgi:DNA-binding SARP family transcriptional activator/tetratricopeptide (TPR) repeat protein